MHVSQKLLNYLKEGLEMKFIDTMGIVYPSPPDDHVVEDCYALNEYVYIVIDFPHRVLN
jgi:hypothetical protein